MWNCSLMMVDNTIQYVFNNVILENCFTIHKWGLIYWEVSRDKIISEYGLSEIWLSIITNEITWWDYVTITL